MIFSTPHLILPPDPPAIIRPYEGVSLEEIRRRQTWVRAIKRLDEKFGTVSILPPELEVAMSFNLPVFAPPVSASGGIDENTILMLHFNGTNGQTTTTDSSQYARTVTRAGNAQLSTAQVKFGSASSLYDGTGDYWTVPDDPDWDFGSGPFTVDWWEYRTVTTSACPVFCRGSVSSNPLMCGYSNTTNILAYAFTSAPWDLLSAFNLGTIATSSWTHFALSRSGNDFYGFKNGTQTSTTSSSAAIANDTETPSIGAEIGTAGAYTGYLDELRVSNVARWTASFTAPTVEYF